MAIELPFSGIARIIVLLLPVIVSLIILAFFLIKGKKGAELYSYVAFEAMVFLWLLTIFIYEFFWYVQQTFNFPWYDMYSKYLDLFMEIPLNFIHFTWVLFVLFFTENRQRKNIKLILPLFGLNVLLFVLAMIAYHYVHQGVNIHFARKIFESCAFPAYAEFFAGTFLLFRYSIKQLAHTRKQALLVMIGASLPVIFRLLQDLGFYLFGLRVADAILAIVYLCEVILISIAIFRYRFLNIVPIALRNLVDNMQPAILVIDMSNRVADTNTSFKSNFAELGSIKINDDIDTFSNTFKNAVDNVEVLDVITNKDIYYYNSELGIKTETDNQMQWKYYAVNVQPVITQRKKILGRIILFNDVTEYKTLVEDLNKKNVQLVEVNEQLEEYAATVEELTIVKERNRFARDVHDTIGHTLTLVVSLLSMARLEIKTNLDDVQEKINKAISIAREGMQEIRCSVAGLTAKNINTKYLVDALKVMSDNFSSSEIEVELDIDIKNKSITSISPLVFDAACKLYKEILTNSLKHGKATKVVAKVELNDVLKIAASDNGIGCKNIVKGFGLSGMEQRVGDLKGRVQYGTVAEKGFSVLIELPIS